MNDDILSEIFEERSAICEFDGGLSRDMAEAIAAVQVEKKRQELDQ